MRCPKIVTAEAISSPKGPGHWYVKGTGTRGCFPEQHSGSRDWIRGSIRGNRLLVSFWGAGGGGGEGRGGGEVGRSLTAGFSDYIRRAVVAYLHNDSN